VNATDATKFPPPRAGHLFLCRNTTRKVHFAWAQGRTLLCTTRFRAQSVVSPLPRNSLLDDDERTTERLIEAEVRPADLCRACFGEQFREKYAKRCAEKSV
jgi:hypothetical protein